MWNTKFCTVCPWSAICIPEGYYRQRGAAYPCRVGPENPTALYFDCFHPQYSGFDCLIRITVDADVARAAGFHVPGGKPEESNGG